MVLLLLFAAVTPLTGQSGLSQSTDRPAGKDWPVYLGDKARTHYSSLDQINKSNVTRLKVAWTYDTGDRGEFQANPLIVNGVVYTAYADTRRARARRRNRQRDLEI